MCLQITCIRECCTTLPTYVLRTNTNPAQVFFAQVANYADPVHTACTY